MDTSTFWQQPATPTCPEDTGSADGKEKATADSREEGRDPPEDVSSLDLPDMSELLERRAWS